MKTRHTEKKRKNCRGRVGEKTSIRAVAGKKKHREKKIRGSLEGPGGVSFQALKQFAAGKGEGSKPINGPFPKKGGGGGGTVNEILQR